MSKLVDVKLSKKSKKEMDRAAVTSYSDGNRWPYGLRLRFENEEFNKLPVLKTLTTGDVVNIVGLGSVVAVSIQERSDGKDDHTVEIQIEKINISPKKRLKDMNMEEFIKARERR